jgi:Amt family ammonium transporter
MISWPIVERFQHGKVEMLGVASAAVAGMVAITPSCGEISPVGALVIGFVAGLVCAFAINFKYKIHVDDTLDVVGVHGFGGIVGVLGIGFFATAAMSGRKGLFYGGGLDLLWRQAVAVVATIAFSFCVTWLIAQAVNRTVGFRTDEEYEAVPGQEEEVAYDQATIEEIRSRLGDQPAPGTAAEAKQTSDAKLLTEVITLLERRERDK